MVPSSVRSATMSWRGRASAAAAVGGQRRSTVRMRCRRGAGPPGCTAGAYWWANERAERANQHYGAQRSQVHHCLGHGQTSARDDGAPVTDPLRHRPRRNDPRRAPRAAVRTDRSPRRQELGAQADGGQPARRRRVRARQRARPRRRVDHGRAAGGDRCHVGADRPGSAGADQRRPAGARRAVRAGRAHPRLGQRARPAAHPLRRGDACRCPAATTSAPARSTCTSPPSRRWVPSSSSPTASCTPAPSGCTAPTSCSPFPSVGATENIVTAAVLATGTTVHRQRGARAGGRRPLRDARGDGRRHHRHRLVAHRDRGRRSRRPATGGPPHGVRPHPGRHLPRRRRRRRRRARGDRRPARAHGEPARPLHRHGPRVHDRRGVAPGRRRSTAARRSTCRRCRTRGSPPTTSR